MRQALTAVCCGAMTLAVLLAGSERSAVAAPSREQSQAGCSPGFIVEANLDSKLLNSDVNSVVSAIKLHDWQGVSFYLSDMDTVSTSGLESLAGEQSCTDGAKVIHSLTLFRAAGKLGERVTGKASWNKYELRILTKIQAAGRAWP
jgi:hypothetical protein